MNNSNTIKYLIFKHKPHQFSIKDPEWVCYSKLESYLKDSEEIKIT